MDIMRAVADGCTKPTTIMYKSNTSWVVLKSNLTSLVAAGFMLENNDGARSTFSITAKGRTVLRDYLNLVYQVTHPADTSFESRSRS